MDLRVGMTVFEYIDLLLADGQPITLAILSKNAAPPQGSTLSLPNDYRGVSFLEGSDPELTEFYHSGTLVARCLHLTAAIE